jgi:hypothetical protein
MMPHAEIDKVWPRDGRIRLTGHLHGRDAEGAGTSWQLLLRLRDHTEELRYDVKLDGSGFTAELPVDDLALDGLAAATWDLHLASGGAGEEVHLRVGRHLDDIRGKKKIYVFPAQSVTSDEDATVVRPFYTVSDNLSIECLPGDIPLREGELSPEWID